MRLLLLGGGWFLGRTLAMDALARGWSVSAFSRGVSGSPPESVGHIRGDRASPSDIAELARSGPWDATIDTSAFEPADVTGALDALGDRAGRYVLVSTVSAYRDWPDEPVDESSALWPARPELTSNSAELADLPGPFRYGTLKAACESAAGDALIVRPGVILGPGEYVGRALELLERAARGGRWLVPGPASQPIQPIDVRDVSAFILHAIEFDLAGPFNLAAPPGHATYGELIDICCELTGNKATPVWVDPTWLAAQDVRQWTEVPLWRTHPGTWQVDANRAIQAGLTFRPLRETLTDFREAPPPIQHPRRADLGLPPAREATLLARWDERTTPGALTSAG